MVVGFITTYPIRAYHHWSCDFESHSWWGVPDTMLCDKVCQWFATGWWFSPGNLVSSTNKTDCHDINEILLKVVLNTMALTSNSMEPEMAHLDNYSQFAKLGVIVNI
jgi:hypothetical protein